MKRVVLLLIIIPLLFSQAYVRIEKVSLTPPRITQKTDVTVEVMPPEPPEGYYYQYIWFVNGKRLELNYPVLAAEYFKKGDFVWAGVYLKDDEDRLIDYKESLRYRVADIPPEIISSPPSAQGLKPGEVYKYTIEVKDEDDPPESITIKLKEAPEDAVLKGNVLEWKIPKKKGKFPFTIVASDPDGGSCAISFEISIGVKKVEKETEKK